VRTVLQGSVSLAPGIQHDTEWLHDARGADGKANAVLACTTNGPRAGLRADLRNDSTAVFVGRKRRRGSRRFHTKRLWPRWRQRLRPREPARHEVRRIRRLERPHGVRRLITRKVADQGATRVEDIETTDRRELRPASSR